MSAAATAMSAHSAHRGMDERPPAVLPLGCEGEPLEDLPVRPLMPRRGGWLDDGGGGGGSLLTANMLRREVVRFSSGSALLVTVVNPPTARVKWLASDRGPKVFQNSMYSRVDPDPDISVQQGAGMD